MIFILLSIVPYLYHIFMMLVQNVSDLLSTLSECEKIYAKAKADLVDIQRKLHGIPYMSSQRIDGATSLTNVLNVKRGRGRPKKNKPPVEIITNATNTTVYSSEQVELERCSDNSNSDDVFNGATYTYINENIYIETKHGNYHDIKTMELRGWYNPYISCHEWL